MAKRTFKNVSDGPRLLNSAPPVTLAAGETVNAELTDAELKSAEATGWFEIGVKADAKPKADAKA